jgi:hypothetical protein
MHLHVVVGATEKQGAYMTDSIQKKMRTGAPTKSAHDLNMIEAACINALAREQSPEGIGEFYSLVNPASVLELMHVAKSALSDEALQELARLMDEMTLYIKLVPDEKGAAKSIDRDELILRTRQLRSLIGI